MSDWPENGCPDCNGLETDCRRCGGTGYLPEPLDRAALRHALLAVFTQHGVSVGVGLTQTGVAIRSQDDRVDASNIGLLQTFVNLPMAGEDG